MMTKPKITVAIPSYRRMPELCICLESILDQTLAPYEVLVHDDASPNQKEIICKLEKFTTRFKEHGIIFRYVTPAENKGYDASLRFLLREGRGEYVLWIGNDDYLLRDAVKTYTNFLISNNDVLLVSRAFEKFVNPGEVVGISKFRKRSGLISKITEINLSFRLVAYFGGLLVKRDWAVSVESDKFDHTLYYQFYLSLLALESDGLYYINKPTVAARVDGKPLFGETDKTGLHTVGKYNVNSRLKMWESVLYIARTVDNNLGTARKNVIQRELMVRMSFHLFEMFHRESRLQNITLARGLHRMKMFKHPVPVGLFILNLLFKSQARLIYILIRKTLQR